MHVFGEHLWQMVQIHDDINLYTMQGLEKLNDLTTLAYFGSSNKHSGKENGCEAQILNKRNRVDFINSIEKMTGDADENFYSLQKYCLNQF